MGADPRVDDASWMLDWIARTGHQQFTRRDAHQAARGRFRKATDLDAPLALLEEHGYLRRADTDPAGPKGGRPASPRYFVNPLHPSTQPTQPTQPPGRQFCGFCGFRGPLVKGATVASAGIRKSHNGRRYQVWWRLDDGSQGSRTFTTRDQAREFKNELLAQAARDAWIDPRRGRILFDDWADRWWQLWSANPRRSPRAWRRPRATSAGTCGPTSAGVSLSALPRRSCSGGSTSWRATSATAG